MYDTYTINVKVQIQCVLTDYFIILIRVKAIQYTINSISVKYNMFRRRLGHPEVSQTISKAHGGRNVQVVV